MLWNCYSALIPSSQLSKAIALVPYKSVGWQSDLLIPRSSAFEATRHLPGCFLQVLSSTAWALEEATAGAGFGNRSFDDLRLKWRRLAHTIKEHKQMRGVVLCPEDFARVQVPSSCRRFLRCL